MLIRADSDTTVMPTTETRFLSQEDVIPAGSRSAPSELMFVPWESPEPEPPQRRVSMQEAKGILGLEAEPVQVGMRDPFSATFGRAVAEAQQEARSHGRPDFVIKRE